MFNSNTKPGYAKNNSIDYLLDQQKNTSLNKPNNIGYENNYEMNSPVLNNNPGVGQYKIKCAGLYLHG